MSDIADEGMSHNDPIRDTEDYEAGRTDSVLRAVQCQRILEDLIAGVQTAIDDYELRMHGSARAYLLGIRDRAKARLRELDTPPNSANERINLGGAGDD